MKYRRTRPADRPYDLGPFPLEELPRDPAIRNSEQSLPPRYPDYLRATAGAGFAESAEYVADLYLGLRHPGPAAAEAPASADLQIRTRERKGLAYFLDAAQVGVCDITSQLYANADQAVDHSHLAVVLVEHGRQPEKTNLASDWLEHAHDAVGRIRAAEIAVCIAGHIAALGFDARAHWSGAGDIDIDKASVLAGLNVRADGEYLNPFLTGHFSLAVVTTNYPLNKVVDLDGPVTEQVPVKKWWQDLEIVDGVCVQPKRTNTRDIDPDRPPPNNQNMAYYPANAMPPPNGMAPLAVDRKAASAVQLETPEEARSRITRGATRPAMYVPSVTVEDEPDGG